MGTSFAILERLRNLTISHADAKLGQQTVRVLHKGDCVSQVQIRFAREDEAELLSDLASRSKAHWPYDKDYLELCRSVTHVVAADVREWPFIVATDGTRVCGFAAACPVQGEYMLDHLWLEPEFIGKGLGRLLFAEAARTARAMGWTKFLIAADPYAEAFYLKMGAKRIGERESKIKRGFFLPLLEYDLGLLLIGDERVRAVPVHDCGDSFIDLAAEFPSLAIDHERRYVQKESMKISLVRRRVGEMLMHAQMRLPTGIRLLIKEGYRPMSVQKRSWDEYFAFLQKTYPHWSNTEVYAECSKLNAPLDVAPHTTGGAVDLTLSDDNGEWLEMGSEFNASPLATNQATYTATENISIGAKKNRQILMSAMSGVGFVNYPTEWWHWSYGDKYWAHVMEKPQALFASVTDEPRV